MERDSLEYRSKLLLGMPIEWEGLNVYPLTIGQIMDFSIEKYNQFTSIISLNRTEIMESLGILEEVSLFDFIIINFISSDNNGIKEMILDILSMIFKDDVIFSVNGYFLIGDSGKKIDSDNFKSLLLILRDQNYAEERKEKFLNKKEREYYEAVKKAREKYKKALKVMGKSETDLLDLISAICSKHQSMNFLNIRQFTIYQLIDQFKRINMIDDYFISIDSLLAGADKKNVKLIHWSKKMPE